MKRTVSIPAKTARFRFKAILPGIFFIAAFHISHSPVVAQTANKNTMKEHTNKMDSGITIHQEVYFNVSPKRVYETLLSSKQFSESTKKSYSNFSATSTKIDSKVGGTFSVFDGHIIGRFLELVPNQRIVQAWRVVDWDPGIYSIVKYELKAQGTGTLLIFDHIGFPDGLKDHLAKGWQEHYWDALTKYFQ